MNKTKSQRLEREGKCNTEACGNRKQQHKENTKTCKEPEECFLQEEENIEVFHGKWWEVSRGKREQLLRGTWALRVM